MEGVIERLKALGCTDSSTNEIEQETRHLFYDDPEPEINYPNIEEIDRPIIDS